jgi:histidyl-tRNA synthetase
MVDKLDRLGLGGVCALLGPGRKDDSGDFTKGRNFRRSDRVFSLS